MDNLTSCNACNQTDSILYNENADFSLCCSKGKLFRKHIHPLIGNVVRELAGLAFLFPTSIYKSEVTQSLHCNKNRWGSSLIKEKIKSYCKLTLREDNGLV